MFPASVSDDKQNNAIGIKKQESCKNRHRFYSFIKMHKGRLTTYNASRSNKINVVYDLFKDV